MGLPFSVAGWALASALQVKIARMKEHTPHPPTCAGQTTSPLPHATWQTSHLTQLHGYAHPPRADQLSMTILAWLTHSVSAILGHVLFNKVFPLLRFPLLKGWGVFWRSDID